MDSSILPNKVKAQNLTPQYVRAKQIEHRPLPQTIEVDGKKRSTTNSNGQPISATEEGVRSFWRWFGDSKVVDAEGKPLVVYHGTTSNIEAFDPSRAGEFGERFANALFFTNNPTVAAGYAQRLDTEHEQLVSIEEELRCAYGKAVVKQYEATKSTSGELTEDIKQQYYAAVNARQERRRSLFTNEIPSEGANIVAVYLRAIAPSETDALGDFFFNTHKKAFEDANKFGSDSVIIRNVVDSANEFCREVGNVFAVFKPTQIKSAIGNSGHFDPTNPNISDSTEPLLSEDSSDDLSHHDQPRQRM